MRALQVMMRTLFVSYWSKRKQCVKINKTRSAEQLITQGVPQGTILGLLFFLLSVNDLPLAGLSRRPQSLLIRQLNLSMVLMSKVLNVNSKLN